MSKADYYDLLGVSKSASQDEIKKAFRKKAMQHHPDRNKGDKSAEHKFKEINEAYEVLKDSNKKAQYDRFGHNAGPSGFGGGGGHGGQGFDFNDFGNFSDVFNDMFGDFTGGGGGRKAQPKSMAEAGSDLRYDVEISLHDAYAGVKKEVSFKTLSHCDDCDGKGAKDPKDVETCGTCKGSGRMRMQQGFFMIERTCSACHGHGKTIKNPCKTCHGQGRVNKSKKLAVQIPKGVEDGMKVRISGEGEAGQRGGKAGDLYVFVHVKKHGFFHRDGADLHCTVPLKVTTAMLGGEIELPTMDGKSVKVSIPESTQSGTQLRVRGKGMPGVRSTHMGDIIITLKVETPKNLSKEQKDLLHKLDGTMDGKCTPDSDGFVKNIKKFFKF